MRIRRWFHRSTGLTESNLVLLSLLIGVVYVARFWHMPNFGLYEDDISIIPLTLSMSPGERIDFVTHYIAKFYGQGRPLHHSLIYLLTPLVWQGTGLGSQGAYLLGFLLVALNASLFYLLLIRIGPQPLAVFGGLAYALFSADTTQAYLTHAVGLQPSLTCLLTSLHLYLSGRKALAYLITIVLLFTYETPFLVFLGAPLLKTGAWDRTRLNELARHGLILGAILVSVFAIRVISGEGRVAGLALDEMLTIPILHMLQGSPVSLGTYALRPYQALRGLNLEIALASLLSAAIFLAAFSRLQAAFHGSLSSWLALMRSPRRLFAENSPQARFARLVISGLIMLALAYPLTFTVRAYAISGRETRVHFAAVAGAAIVVGASAVILRSLSNGRLWFRAANLFLALLFGTLVGFGFLVQQDYMRAWDYQTGFWQELYPMIQDAGEATAILIEPTGLRDTRYIDANTWNLPEYLDEIHFFPETWAGPPRVYRLVPGWQAHILTEERQLRLSGNTVTSSTSFHRLVPPENTIAFSTSTGSLQRLSELETERGRVSLRRVRAGKNRLADYPTGPSYELLFDEPYSGPSPFLIP